MLQIFCKQLKSGDSTEIFYGFEWISILKAAYY